LKLLRPTRFRYFLRRLRESHFTVLDIGCGNHSATATKFWFPHCEYYGTDISRSYANDEHDFGLMAKFYEKDLTKLEFSDIPDHFFDVMLMTHVIEHLPNGDLVLEQLLPKLKQSGVLYLEYPGARSLRLPKMQGRGTLNFYDDTTHVRVYSLDELAPIVERNGFRIIKKGTRRDWQRLALMPLLVANSLLRRSDALAGDFWDLLGFAEFIYAEKI